MRPIDADELDRKLASLITDDRGGNLTNQQIANNEAIVDTMIIIHAQQTVEAIPVEWIQRKIDMLEQNMDSDLPKPAMLAQLHELVSLKRLVTDWEKERWAKIVGEKEE